MDKSDDQQSKNRNAEEVDTKAPSQNPSLKDLGNKGEPTTSKAGIGLTNINPDKYALKHLSDLAEAVRPQIENALIQSSQFEQLHQAAENVRAQLPSSAHLVLA